MEVIIAVILVLVLFIYGRDLEFTDREKLDRTKIESLERRLEETEERLREARNELRLERKRADKLEEENEVLRQLAVAMGTSEDHRDELLRLRRELDSLKKENLRLKELIGGGAGKDKPDCQIPEYPGEIGYFASISVDGDLVEFTVEPNPILIPLLREHIPGLSRLMDSSPMSKTQFKTSAYRAYKWSDSRDPVCRLRISFAYDPDSPQSDLKMVQDYFYYRHQ